MIAAETGLPNILCAGLQSVRACLSRSDFRESALLGFIELTKVDPPRMSIVSIDTELLFGVIKREIDIVHIGSPLAVPDDVRSLPTPQARSGTWRGETLRR